MRKKNAKRIRRFQPWQIALLIVLAVLLAGAVALGVLDARHVRFYMSGAEEISLRYGERYEEPGIYAVSVGRLFGEGRRRLPVTVRGSVGEELGEYTLRYVTPYLFRLYGTERRVTVVDETPPVLRLHSREDYRPSWFDGYVEEGWEAWDDHDGDLSAAVLRLFRDGFLRQHDGLDERTGIRRRRAGDHARRRRPSRSERGPFVP